MPRAGARDTPIVLDADQEVLRLPHRLVREADNRLDQPAIVECRVLLPLELHRQLLARIDEFLQRFRRHKRHLPSPGDSPRACHHCTSAQALPAGRAIGRPQRTKRVTRRGGATLMGAAVT